MSDETEPETSDGRALPRWLWPTVVAAAAIAAGFLASRQPSLPEFSAEGPPVTLPASGELAPIDPVDLQGILAGQEGRPVVVNIWASWCAPCRAEMPLLQNAAASYGDDAVILGVAANDTPSAAADFIDELDITYPNTFDRTGNVARALDVSAFPTTYVFGADGELRAEVRGGISEQRLAGLVDDALAATETP
ncbi:MAG: TlpA disulfide reductase family protein [Actinomycetota bacterium]